MADRFDPSRAKPETILEVCDAFDNAASSVVLIAARKLATECRIPLRSRAEVDAEIANTFRRAVDQDVVPTRFFQERIEKLCAEPTQPSVPAGADVPPASPGRGTSSGSPGAALSPLGKVPSAPEGAALPEERPCSCEESEDLRKTLLTVHRQLVELTELVMAALDPPPIV